MNASEATAAEIEEAAASVPDQINCECHQPAWTASYSLSELSQSMLGSTYGLPDNHGLLATMLYPSSKLTASAASAMRRMSSIACSSTLKLEQGVLWCADHSQGKCVKPCCREEYMQ